MAFEKVGVRAVIEGLSAFNRDARTINQRLKEVTGNLDKTADSAESSAKSFSDLGADLAVVGAGFAAVGAASGALLYSSVRLAARVETLGVVTATLGRNVGYTEAQIRELEQAVAAQGITLQGSRSAIALMIQSNIDLAHATELAREAQDAAVIANVNSTEAFQRLVFVITSGNVRMARTLGLQVSFQNAYEQTAAALGKTTLELTEQEKVAARTNAVIEAGANITGAYSAAMETTGKRVLSLDRFQEEANRIFGEQFVPIMGTVVDILTEVLSKYSELSGFQRNLIGSGVTLAATTGTVTGGFLLATAAATKFVSSFKAVAAVVGVSTLTFAAWAVAIGAVVAAAVLLVNHIADVRAKQKALTEAGKDFVDQTLRSTNTVQEFNAEMERANNVIDQQGALGKLLTSDFAELNEEQYNAAKAALAWYDAQNRTAEATDQQGDVISQLADNLGLTRERFLEVAEAAGVALDNLDELPDTKGIELQVRAQLEKETQERLQKELSDLQFTIDTDITVQLEDVQKKREELQKQIQDLVGETFEARAEIITGGEEERAKLKQRLSELYGDLQVAQARLDELDADASESSRLAAKQRIQDIRGQISEAQTEIAGLSDETAGKLDELDQTYQEKRESIVGQIDEVTEAWKRQTKEIIFNLAVQRFGLDGFTDEELDALTTLAGPEGLGLIDEGAVALLESIDKLNDAMKLPGDQAPLVSDALGQMSDAMADPTQNASDLADALRDVVAAADELAHAPFPTPRFETDPFAHAPQQTRQFGGSVQRGRSYLVGERGPEIFAPRQSGGIFPDLMSMIAKALPMAAPPSLAMAGAGGSIETTNNYNQTINTAAPAEPIMADFNLLALMGRRRTT